MTSVFAYPYDGNLADLPNRQRVNGIETRTNGVDEIYNIPIEQWPDAIRFTVKGGDGGNAKATSSVGSDKEAKGGGGVEIVATFPVHLSNANSLRPGGEIRYVVGSRGKSQTEGVVAGGGGGGASGV